MRAFEASGELLAGISTDLVRLHHRLFGKGPTKAKTFARDEIVVCLLTGGRTTIEQTLLESGDVDAVNMVRHSYNSATERHFKAVVERATGRPVIAYITQDHHVSDLTAHLFVLEPTEDEEELA